MQLDEELALLYQSCKDYEQLIKAFNKYFTGKRKVNLLPARLIRAKEIIDQDHGNVSLEKVASDCHLSSRQLLRDFHNYIDLSGKEYAKVVRFNYLLKQIEEDDFLSLALQGGYFDQAHFNKVFKQITKTTPKKYLSNLADFYNEIYKF